MRLIEQSGTDTQPLSPPTLADTGASSVPETLTGQLVSMRSQLQQTAAADVPAHEVLDALRVLEDLTRAAAAVTATLSDRFHTDQVAEHARRGLPRTRRAKAVADDLALTRKTSPYLASRELTSARALVSEMPRMLEALSQGELSGDTARMVTEETVCLEPHHRTHIDELIAPRVHGMSPRQLRAEVRALTQELDPEALVRRARKATEDRGVWVRPVPDVMALLSARLPAAAAIACHTSLATHADALKASGDERSRSQIMADELFARLTGRSAADGVDVEVQLVMTDAALLAGDPAAAILNGYGPVPAQSARDLLSSADDPAENGMAMDSATEGTTAAGPTAETATAETTPSASLCPAGGRCSSSSCTLVHGPPLPFCPAYPPGSSASTPQPSAAPTGPAPTAAAPQDPQDPQNTVGTQDTQRQAGRAARVYLRRLYTNPQTGQLTARDSRRRLFPPHLRAVIISRDQYCRTPWCGAPVRHVDHRIRWADGGHTTLDNGQGLCAHCNLAREHERTKHLTPGDYLPAPPILPTFLRQARAG